MEERQRYTLKKAERLKSRKIIDQLFKEEKSFSIFPFRVMYAFDVAFAHNEQANGGGSNLVAGFSVGTKFFKKAVDRNRVKRLMREAYRLQKNELNKKITETKKNLVVFFIYTGNEKPEYKMVFEKIGKVIIRLIKIADEVHVPNT